MYKSTVVKLVFLNSVLALSACDRPCHQEPVMKDGKQVLDERGQPLMRNTCQGRVRSGGGGHFIYIGGGGGGVRTGRPGTGSVGRGGFGSTGHASGS